MAERASVLPFPKWLIALDLVAAVSVCAGLFLRNAPDWMGRFGLPAGTDLLLLALGGMGVLGCGARFGSIAMTAARSKSSR